MNRCAHSIEVEDWALGLLDDEAAARASEHAAVCSTCRDALRAFARERALFESRARQAPAPPPFAVLVLALDDAEPKNAPPVRVLPRRLVALLAAAACLAGLAVCARALRVADDRIVSDRDTVRAVAGSDDLDDHGASCSLAAASCAVSAAPLASYASLGPLCADDSYAARASVMPAVAGICAETAVCSVAGP